MLQFLFFFLVLLFLFFLLTFEAKQFMSNGKNPPCKPNILLYRPYLLSYSQTTSAPATLKMKPSPMSSAPCFKAASFSKAWMDRTLYPADKIVILVVSACVVCPTDIKMFLPILDREKLCFTLLAMGFARVLIKREASFAILIYGWKCRRIQTNRKRRK